MAENSSNIKDRVLQVSDLYGVGKEKFFEKIGVSYGNFKGKSKKSSLSSDVLAEISTLMPEVNTDWLLTGKGPMTKDQMDTMKERLLSGMELRAEMDLPGPDARPLIPIEAMAGFGTAETTITQQDIKAWYVVPDFNSFDFMIKVKGSSMYPKYSSGDVVACKKLPLTDLFFQWNKVYVLDTVQGPIIKRIKKGSDDKHVLIVSENTNYEPFELPLKAINSVAIVIGVIRLE
jgi:phage repressor protein C with HTH and peptisase S24 domain